MLWRPCFPHVKWCHTGCFCRVRTTARHLLFAEFVGIRVRHPHANRQDQRACWDFREGSAEVSRLFPPARDILKQLVDRPFVANSVAQSLRCTATFGQYVLSFVVDCTPVRVLRPTCRQTFGPCVVTRVLFTLPMLTKPSSRHACRLPSINAWEILE